MLKSYLCSIINITKYLVCVSVRSNFFVVILAPKIARKQELSKSGSTVPGHPVLGHSLAVPGQALLEGAGPGPLPGQSPVHQVHVAVRVEQAAGPQGRAQEVGRLVRRPGAGVQAKIQTSAVFTLEDCRCTDHLHSFYNTTLAALQ